MGEETRMSGTQARRQRNPRGQGERLREDIIEAATRLLEDPAAPPLSLRAVAREVGVAATSVYLHFDDVESLVRAVASRRFTDLIRAQDEATAGVTGPCDRLRAACLMYCEFGLAHPGHYQVTFTNPLPVGDDVPWDQMPGRRRGSTSSKASRRASRAHRMTPRRRAPHCCCGSNCTESWACGSP